MGIDLFLHIVLRLVRKLNLSSYGVVTLAIIYILLILLKYYGSALLLLKLFVALLTHRENFIEFA